MVSVWLIRQQPTSAMMRLYSSSERAMRKPGMLSSLSSVPPVWPRPRPDIFGTTTPHAAASGEHDRDLVANTAGAVLADLDPRNVIEVDAIAGIGHRFGEPCRLHRVHALEHDGHQQRGRLVVLPRSIGDTANERLDRLARQGF